MAKPGWASISELQRITGVDRATIAKRLAHITPEEGAKSAKLYEVARVLPYIVGKSDASTEDIAKARRSTADAEKAELVVARMRGELVSVDAMKQAAAELVKTMYQRTVRITPAILAPKLVGKTDATEIEIAIRAELAGIFDELRTLPESFISVEEEIAEEMEGEDA